MAFTAFASAQSYTFPTFDIPVVPSDDIFFAPFDVTPVPAGSYNFVEVTMDWTALSGGPWSSEAEFALGDAFSPTTVYQFLTSFSNGASNGSPVSLTYSGFLDQAYTGGPLGLVAIQAFPDSTAAWENISVTLSSSVLLPPPSVQTFVGGSLTTTLTSQDVLWFEFDYTAGDLTIDTFGSTLTGGSFGDGNDSEIGLYDSTGALVATNDDAPIGGTLLSELSFLDGELAAGTYYLAVGGFDTVFGSGFSVTSTSPVSGTLVVNGLSIPEPTSLAGLALAAGGLVRRRRA
ncbi:MAG: DVUA0089 family protein [Phycisphaerae bacterium]